MTICLSTLLLRHQTAVFAIVAVALLLGAFLAERTKAVCPLPAPCPAPPAPPVPVCFPVAPAARATPVHEGNTFLVNGTSNPLANPPQFVTIDAAIAAFGAGDNIIVIDGSVFDLNNPATAPVTPMTGSVRITSANPAVPAAISNATIS
jgi:hypothetical protein